MDSVQPKDQITGSGSDLGNHFPSGEGLSPGMDQHGGNDLVDSEDLDSDYGEHLTSATLSKATAKQASHYMLTFENGLQDDSDWEVEELTKSLPNPSDRNNNSHADQKDGSAEAGPRSGLLNEQGSLPPASHQHLVRVVKESDSELSDEGILDRPTDEELQIPLGDSDTDNESAPQWAPTGGFLHIAGDGNSSVRPDTPTPSTPRDTGRTRIAVDSNPDSGSEMGFVRPKPLSGSTTAVFGSVESLTQPQVPQDVQYRKKTFSASVCNLSASGPVEGPFGNVVTRRKAFHGSMNRLSLGAMPTASAVVYTSEDESRKTVERRPTPARRALTRRWSLAHTDTDALEEVR